MTKRLFDVIVAIIGLAVCAPVLMVTGVLVRMTSRGPILFCQERMGRDFRPFTIYKFRTMVVDAPDRGTDITCGDDPRITRVGRLLRATKIDELPQLFNVLLGDMSFVGPRPELRRYVEMFKNDYREILSVRPGITDPASILFRTEATILGRAADPHAEYVERILPHKIRLAKEYRYRSSLLYDVGVILQTVFAIVHPQVFPETTETS